VTRFYFWDEMLSNYLIFLFLENVLKMLVRVKLVLRFFLLDVWM